MQHPLLWPNPRPPPPKDQQAASPGCPLSILFVTTAPSLTLSGPHLSKGPSCAVDEMPSSSEHRPVKGCSLQPTQMLKNIHCFVFLGHPLKRGPLRFRAGCTWNCLQVASLCELEWFGFPSDTLFYSIFPPLPPFLLLLLSCSRPRLGGDPRSRGLPHLAHHCKVQNWC